MEQMQLFSDGSLDYVIGTETEYPISYRTDKHGYFVTTAQVAGVGTVHGRDRFLWEAVCECREKIALALAAAPTSMF